MEPKYKIGDEVFFIEDQGVRQAEVLGILRKKTTYLYVFEEPRYLHTENAFAASGEQYEENLFPSKEALIQSL